MVDARWGRVSSVRATESGVHTVCTSFSDSSPLGANVYYRGTVALGRTGLIPAAHVYEGGLRKVGMPGMSGD